MRAESKCGEGELKKCVSVTEGVLFSAFIMDYYSAMI